MAALAVPFTHMFSSALVNEFRGGFDYNNPSMASLNGQQIVNQLGFTGLVTSWRKNAFSKKSSLRAGRWS